MDLRTRTYESGGVLPRCSTHGSTAACEPAAALRLHVPQRNVSVPELKEASTTAVMAIDLSITVPFPFVSLATSTVLLHCHTPPHQQHFCDTLSKDAGRLL